MNKKGKRKLYVVVNTSQCIEIVNTQQEAADLLGVSVNKLHFKDDISILPIKEKETFNWHISFVAIRYISPNKNKVRDYSHLKQK